MKFRRKLSLIFAVFALVPSTILILFSALLLTSSLDQWLASGPARALEEARVVSSFALDSFAEATRAQCLLQVEKMPGGPTGLSGLSSDSSFLSRAELDWFGLRPAHSDQWAYAPASEVPPNQEIAAGLRTGSNYVAFDTSITLDGESVVFSGGRYLPDTFVASEEKLEMAAAYFAALELASTGGNTFVWLSAGVLIAVLWLSVVWAATRLSRDVSGPLESLREGTVRLAQGDLDFRLEEYSPDEFGEVSRAFDDMAAQIKASRERALRAERAAAWRDIARKVAHEIKNPLTPIKTELYRIKARLGGSPGDVPESLDIISEELDGLANLADEFSRLGKMPPMRPAPCDLNEMLAKVASLYSGAARDVPGGGQGRHAGVTFVGTPDLPRMNLDEEMMRRAVGNVVKNAVEASRKGQVLIRTERTGDKVRIYIEDEGPGLPVGAENRIFDPYFTDKKGGSGLGLAVALKIVEDHGGTISASNRKPRGAVFVIELPLSSGEPVG